MNGMDDPRKRQMLDDYLRYQVIGLPDPSAPSDLDSPQPQLPPHALSLYSGEGGAGAPDVSAPPNPADYIGYPGTATDLAPPSSVPTPPPPSSAPAMPFSPASIGYSGDTASLTAPMSRQNLSPEERAKQTLAPHASVDKYGDLRYPHRSVGQVFGDIGRGALLHLVRGENPLLGAVTGGLGIDRQAALNQRVAEETQSQQASDQYKAAQAEALRKQQDSEQKRALEDARGDTLRANAETNRVKAQALADVGRHTADLKQKTYELKYNTGVYGNISIRNKAITNQINELQKTRSTILSYGKPGDPEVQDKINEIQNDIDALQKKMDEPFQTPTTQTTPAAQSPATPDQKPGLEQPSKKPTPNLETGIGKKIATAPDVKTSKGLYHRTPTGQLAPTTVEGTGEVAQPPAKKGGGTGKPGVKVREKDPGNKIGSFSQLGQGTYDKSGKRTSWAPYFPGTNRVNEAKRENYK